MGSRCITASQFPAAICRIMRCAHLFQLHLASVSKSCRSFGLINGICSRSHIPGWEVYLLYHDMSSPPKIGNLVALNPPFWSFRLWRIMQNPWLADTLTKHNVSVPHRLCHTLLNFCMSYVRMVTSTVVYHVILHMSVAECFPACESPAWALFYEWWVFYY